MFFLFWDILLIFCQLHEFKGSQASYRTILYFTQVRSTWINAARKCTLWTPPFEYSTKSVNITQEYINEDLWIGYHLVQATFEFHGCWHTENYKTLLLHNGNGLGRCYSACGGTLYIGISNISCFCTNKIPTKRVEPSQCNAECAGRHVPCGKDGYMALYKVNLTDNDAVRLVDEDGRPLNISVHKCQKRNGQITSSENVVTLQNGTALCWEWVRRRKVIVKYNASSFASSVLNKTTQPFFGYVNKTADGQVLLRFGSNTQLKRALCAKAHSTSTEDYTDGNTGVAIVVSVVAAILFTVIASVFLILKRRRKLPNLCKKTMLTEKSEYTEPDKIMSSNTHVNPSYGVIDKANEQNVGKQDDNINDTQPYSVIMDSNDSQPYSVIEGPIREPDQPVEDQNRNNNGAHDYFILEASARESGQNVENNSHNYFVLEKQTRDSNEAVTTYDTTKPGITQNNINDGNVYNKINEARNAEHDHVYNTTKKELQNCDKTYDTTEKALTGADKYSDENNEDTYNHVDRKPLDCNRSDNIYGIPLEKISQKGATRQFDQLELDTYSHLNSKPTNNTKPDNIYGIQNEMIDGSSLERNSDGDYSVTHNINAPSVTDNTYSKLETQ